MKKVLIGLANNIHLNKDKIKLWANSFRKHSDAEVVLLGANMDENDVAACKEINITVFPCEVPDPGYINHKRLEHIRSWLSSSDADLILSTDVFDVAFQNDPFSKLDCQNFDFFVGGEGLDVHQEPWNSSNINCLFKDQFEKCLSQEIICSGVIAGKKEAMISVYDRMFDLCEKSPNSHNIKDQAALIVMIAHKEIPNLKVFNLDDGWVVHCATSGPTRFFEDWGFKNNLKYGVPKMIDGMVYTGSGLLFDMVHQFNRIPEWDNLIRERYL